MANLSSLAPGVTAATALSNLILVTPTQKGYQPQNPPNADGTPSTNAQPPALLFNYEGEQTLTLESDITDHFIEDNTSIQDQIALKPISITTHGFIGELNDVVPPALAALNTIANKLTTISGYVPSLSTSALLAYNNAFLVYQVAQNAANSAVSAWNSLNSQPQKNQTKQQVAFQQFFGYYQSRTLFTVQTPWAVFPDMAIKTLRAIQDADTRVMTDFEITFKQIRTASTITAAGGVETSYQDRANAQANALQELGSSTPPLSPISFNSAFRQVG